MAARRALSAGFARWEELLTEALRRLDAGGHLHTGADPTLLAAGLLAAYQGGMLLSNVEGRIVPMRRALQVAVSAAVPASAERKQLRRGSSARRLARPSS
ncbi:MULTISPECIES: TetR family transcriptional regulator C-terminal domain-containing protein [Mycobacteriaceae]